MIGDLIEFFVVLAVVVGVGILVAWFIWRIAGRFR
jgi:hypothetical protein